MGADGVSRLDGNLLRISRPQLQKAKKADEARQRRREQRNRSSLGLNRRGSGLAEFKESKQTNQRAGALGRAKRNPKTSLNYNLKNITRRARGEDPHQLFESRVDRKKYPDYYTVVKEPMCLEDITRRAARDGYRSRHEYLDDFRLMAFNALQYNGSEHPVYKAADELRSKVIEFFDDVEEELTTAEKELGTFVMPFLWRQGPDGERDNDINKLRKLQEEAKTEGGASAAAP